MIKHTAEPWDDELTPKVPKGSSQLLLNGKLRPPADCRVLSEPDFQRAKACVNACAGISNELLADMSMYFGKQGRTYYTLVYDMRAAQAERDQLKTQCKELLDALRDMVGIVKESRGVDGFHANGDIA